jgi:DNA polymerase beta
MRLGGMNTIRLLAFFHVLEKFKIREAAFSWLFLLSPGLKPPFFFFNARTPLSFYFIEEALVLFLQQRHFFCPILPSLCFRMDPAFIAAKLALVCEAYRSSGNIHKYHAYRNAIDVIKRFDGVITSSSQLKALKGVGKSMLDKVDEILSTGALKQQQDVLQDPVLQALLLFTEVHGIGPVLARKLVIEQGLRTLEDLRDLGQQLPPQVRLGLKHHADASQRIPYDEIELHLTFIKKIARRIDSQLSVTICGSHRRGLATSGDIDVLVTHPASSSDSGSEYVFLAVLLRYLREANYVVDTLSEGPHKFMGYCRLAGAATASDCTGAISDTTNQAFSPLLVHRLDVRWFAYDCFFPALLYFTGSDMFNINMRAAAVKLGLTMNEYGLYKHRPNDSAALTSSPQGSAKGERIVTRSEEEIFSILGLKYVPPTDRM